MTLWKTILNLLEITLLSFGIYGILTEYSGKFSSYRYSWDESNADYIRLSFDIIVIGIFILRIFQIIVRIIKKNLPEISRKQLLLILVLYVISVGADLSQYAYWFYYTDLTAPAIRLGIYTIPVLIWIYRMRTEKLHKSA